MADPLVFIGIDVEFCPHRVRVEVALRPCINKRASLVAERPALEIPFDHVGLGEGAQVLHDPPDPGDERVISSKGMFFLRKIPDCNKQSGNQDPQQPPCRLP